MSPVARQKHASAYRARALGSARALLHLINFDEPFGLSVVEAMACGTPVIAAGRGSMEEIVEPGKSGFLVHSVEQAVQAINATHRIDRHATRASVEERFSVGRMADEYLALYRRILSEQRHGRGSAVATATAAY